MNREINFRIWDKISKTLIYDNLSLFWFHIPRAINGQDEIEGESNLISLSEILAHPDFVAQQYTGLKDRNGIPIFEGDLVKVYLKTEEIGKITFDRGGFCFNSKSFTGTFLGIVESGFHIEIIGNIFENPELLKTNE